MMHNLVILCKSYRGDLKRIKILKETIDKYNADNLPFYIVCPQEDIGLFKNVLIKGNEKYILCIISDEDVLKANNLAEIKQDWHTQQLIKLGFYKLGICKHYTILDSDCYFIQNFYFSDFMYDENIPYFYMNEHLTESGDRSFVKKLLNRKGKIYNFVYNSQVFSTSILEDFENNFLHKNSYSLKDIINLYPYEFQWYGEWFLHCNIYPLYYTSGKIKVFWNQLQYQDERKKGVRQQDIVNQGYIAILLNNGWVKDSVYKNPFFGKIYRLKRIVLEKLYERRKRSLFKTIKLYLKLPVIIAREFWNA